MYTEIALEDRVKADDRVASAMLHTSAATTYDTESSGTVQEVSSAPEVSHSLSGQSAFINFIPNT